MTSTLAELGPQLGEPASGAAQPGTVRDLLQQASVALDAGRQLKARLLLEEVLQADPRSERGWLWMADAVGRLAARSTVIVQPIEAEWMAAGDPLRHLKATIKMSLRRDDMRDGLVAYLRSLEL